MNGILNISEAASIAIHSMVLIAGNESKLNATKISEILNNSRSHTAKILKILVKFNFLNSDRGPKGGFTLKTNAGKIMLIDLFEVFDGKIEMNHCDIFNGKCPFNKCVFGNLNKKASSELKNYLSKNSILDLINK